MKKSLLLMVLFCSLLLYSPSYGKDKSINEMTCNQLMSSYKQHSFDAIESLDDDDSCGAIYYVTNMVSLLKNMKTTCVPDVLTTEQVDSYTLRIKRILKDIYKDCRNKTEKKC